MYAVCNTQIILYIKHLIHSEMRNQRQFTICPQPHNSMISWKSYKLYSITEQRCRYCLQIMNGLIKKKNRIKDNRQGKVIVNYEYIICQQKLNLIYCNVIICYILTPFLTLTSQPLLPSSLKLQNFTFTTPNVYRFGISFTYVKEVIKSKLISVYLINDYSLIADLHIFDYGSAEFSSISLECTKVKLLILNNFEKVRQRPIVIEIKR